MTLPALNLLMGHQQQQQAVLEDQVEATNNAWSCLVCSAFQMAASSCFRRLISNFGCFRFFLAAQQARCSSTVTYGTALPDDATLLNIIRCQEMIEVFIMVDGK